MSNLTDFFPSGGGGGLTPKFQEFNASGTFTPSQALIDAGGYIEVFLVAGGGGGYNASSTNPGRGGQVKNVKMYLTSVSNITVTLGSGGYSNNPGNPGGDSSFLAASAGGFDAVSTGGAGGGSNRYFASAWWPGGNGVNGYGAAGFNTQNLAGSPGDGAPNSGQGGAYQSSGGSGYCLIKWYE
jgi:hypothetical protein